MAIPRPTFILVDDCPGWCTFDHDKLAHEPGDHDTTLTKVGEDDVVLLASANNGLEVSVTIGGGEAIPDATHRGSRAPHPPRTHGFDGRLPTRPHRGL